MPHNGNWREYVRPEQEKREYPPEWINLLGYLDEKTGFLQNLVELERSRHEKKRAGAKLLTARDERQAYSLINRIAARHIPPDSINFQKLQEEIATRRTELSEASNQLAGLAASRIGTSNGFDKLKWRHIAGLMVADMLLDMNATYESPEAVGALFTKAAEKALDIRIEKEQEGSKKKTIVCTHLQAEMESINAQLAVMYKNINSTRNAERDYGAPRPLPMDVGGGLLWITNIMCTPDYPFKPEDVPDMVKDAAQYCEHKPSTLLKAFHLSLSNLIADHKTFEGTIGKISRVRRTTYPGQYDDTPG